MSSVEKMQIMGFRSYSPNEPAVIEFQKPLTLIVGHNGAGKTSIIECLRYTATGDMPPGSKGDKFVHDPNVSGDAEVKGQVKLKMKDVTGQTVVVTRSMSSIQKIKKIETKTLEGSIKRQSPTGEMVSLSSRCTEINREVIGFLGVSKPVLDNVIFCHQEDASWPLSEGKVLKQKFDEIFAATRYIKALDSIRKFRQEQTQLVKEYNIDLGHLKNNRDKADEVQRDLENTERRLEASRQNVKMIEKKLVPVEEQLNELNKLAKEISVIEMKIGNLDEEKKRLKKNEEGLRDKIENIFTGSQHELMEMSRKFKSTVAEKEKNLSKFEEKGERLFSEYQSLSAEHNQVLMVYGKLEQEAERHQKNIKDRDHLIQEYSKQYDIPGFERSPFTPEQVKRFTQMFQEKYSQVDREGKKQKAVFEGDLDNLQKEIDKFKEMQTKYQQTIKFKKDLLVKNQERLKQIGRELSNVDASASRLSSVEQELKTAEQELSEAQGSANLSQMETELQGLQQEKRQVDSELSRLREEQQILHAQSSAQAKLDTLNKEKGKKEDACQKLLDKHDEGLNNAFDSRGDLDTIGKRLNELIKNKSKEMRNATQKVQQLRQDLSSKMASQNMIKDELKKKEDQLASYQGQMSEACGNKEYNTVKEELETSIEENRGLLSELDGLKSVFTKFLKRLQDKHECPLCKRGYGSQTEWNNTIENINQTLAKVPTRLQECNAELGRDDQKYKKVLELRPVKDNVETLANREIPNIKKRLDEVTTAVGDLRGKIEEYEEVTALIELEESAAREMLPDMQMLENYRRELHDLDRQIATVSSKMQTTAPGRNMTVVSNEITEKQDRSETLNRHIDRKRNHITQLNRQLSTLESNVVELRSQKLKLTGQMQKRTSLEDQKAELSANNQTHTREIKETENQLQPIQEHLMKLQGEFQEVKQKMQTQETESRRKLSVIDNHKNDVESKNTEINRYVSDRRDKALEESSKKLEDISSRAKQVEQQREKVAQEINSFKEDIARQQVRARELEDNLTLLQTLEDIKKVEQEASEMKKQLGETGNHNDIVRQINNLNKTSDGYRAEKAEFIGRQRGFEDEIRRLTKELNSDLFKNAEDKHKQKLIQVKTTELANNDLDKYYKALDRAIMRFHSVKMTEINKIIREYWINTYRGNDIDTIEIRSDEEEGSGASKARRSYNYRVVMIKGEYALDMRGRCSAGQKVLASLIIRLALAETFCLNCGILCLDEPTTNLDAPNIASLANHLGSIINSRQSQRNFQLIIITHDEEFVQYLGRSDYVDYYYRVCKDDDGYSKIYKQSIVGSNE